MPGSVSPGGMVVAPADGVHLIGSLEGLGVVERFRSLLGFILKARADLEAGCLDLEINSTDVLAVITGLQDLDANSSGRCPVRLRVRQ